MKHSLVINSQWLDIWRHTATGIEHEMKLDANDAKTTFQHWLLGARRRCTLVADLPDERHTIERLPHTSRADRLQLIRRKLVQHFPDAAFTNATPLPAGSENGMLKPVLLSALPRSPSIAPWLDILIETGMQGRIDVPLLTSVPFLAERWYRRQHTLPPQCLLLTLGAGGMRQIFFQQRRLTFSRVIAARASTLAENLPAYRDELVQTLAWLLSQRLVEGTPPIAVLAAEANFPLLRELAPSQNSSMDFIDITRCPNGSALALILSQTRHSGPPTHYDCPPLRRVRKFTVIRRATWASTVATLAIGMASAAVGFVNAAHLHHETGQFIAEQQKLQNELEKLNAETLIEPGADFPDEWFNKAESLIRDPGIASIDILQAIAGLLHKAPWARLESLSWKKLPTQDEGTSTGNQPSQDVQPGKEANAKIPHSAQSASIELEISLTGNEPPQTAADRLVSVWQQQYGLPMKAHIDPGMARLRLDTTLALPPREKSP